MKTYNLPSNFQLLRNMQEKRDNVAEQYTINLPPAVAFYGRHLKTAYCPQASIKTFSAPSLLSVSKKSTCIRQNMAAV
jgi:hypothetical protein